VLCIANEDRDLLAQLAATLSVGARAVWPAVDRSQRLARALPPAISRSIDLVSDWKAADFDVVLHHGTPDETRKILHQVAERDGPIASVHALRPGDDAIPLVRLVTERVVSINTAAAGGNASLMTVG